MEEMFQLLNTGIWSIVPPLLALALALITKEVYSSLIIGVFAGTIIYFFTLGGAGFNQLITAFATVPQIMGAQLGGNGSLILFLLLLGALVMVIAAAGGSRAYGEWVASRIKSTRGAMLLTTLLGIIIFVDDYFNCLTVGAVMRPVTDRFKISHEKLAWVIDSTAAPVCIIAPVSSWAVAIGGYMENGFTDFVASIPYNLYALLTIFFVLLMIALNKDYGPMRTAQIEYEQSAPEIPGVPGSEDSDLDFSEKQKVSTMVDADSEEIRKSAEGAVEEFDKLEKTDKGTIWDLVVPIIVLIIFCILGMLYVGGFFSGVDFGTAVGEDPISGLNIGVLVALVVSALMFLPRKLLTTSEFMDSVVEGGRSMVGPIFVLILAWSLGGVCRHMLGTGDFVSGFLTSVGVNMAFMPVVIFLVAAFIAFAMGTSWGTIALVLPIVIGVFPSGNPLYLTSVGAALAGAVYGDHCSPISDTTILSSAGAQCNHLRHVTTQMAYATTVMIVCAVGYIVIGFTQNPWLGLAVGAVLIVLAVLLLQSLWSRAEVAKPKAR